MALFDVFCFLMSMSVSIFINSPSSLAELRHMESKSILLVSECSWNFCCVSSGRLTPSFFFKTIFTVMINKSAIVRHANCWRCSSDPSCNKSAKKLVNNHLRLVACFFFEILREEQPSVQNNNLIKTPTRGAPNATYGGLWIPKHSANWLQSSGNRLSPKTDHDVTRRSK